MAHDISRRLTLVACGAVLATLSLAAQAPAPQQPRAVFRAALDTVSVDVVVRDRDGAVVRGLTAKDFEVREDGRPQAVTSFSFEEIATTPLPPLRSADLLAGVEARVRDEARTGVATPPAAAVPGDARRVGSEAPTVMTADMLAGRRLITLVFDVSSMPPEDVQRAVDSARKYVDEQMTPADLIAVATVGTMLNVLTDFTDDRARVAAALAVLAYTDGTATELPEALTAFAEEIAAADEAADADVAELDLFNNDVRLRALKTLAEALAPIEQRKAILYFSGGLPRSGQDNQVELRALINAAVQAHVAFYPIDTRGLQAVVPGGDARQASGRGTGMFSGRGMAQQFARLSASQDTLTSLAADTGGRAFTDSNDFGEAFGRVQQDLSAYYLLGYSSTHTVKDGRFRRIQVRVLRDGLRVEARAGYYAERDFAHTARGDRETQLQAQLMAAVSSTDLPVMIRSGFFRLAGDRYYVPLSLAVPGSAVPVLNPKDRVSLDVLGMVRDELGRPLGRFRETLQFPPGTGTTLAGSQVLYQSGVTLPPGRYAVKAVVRENATGLVGSFEAPIVVPELKEAPLKVSSVVLSTQLQPAPRGRTDNPLVRDGVQLLPSLTHVVGQDQKLFFYYEVYDPSQEGSAPPEVRTSLAFYRGKVKVYETPMVERASIDVPTRRAALFQFEVPAGSFTPGLYTCQINIIDAVAGEFAFPRLAFYVR